MKSLFVLRVTYTAPIEVIDKILSEHRLYLKKGYEAGFLLASGSQIPRTGGVIIGQFKDKQAAIAFSEADPFVQNNVATYEFIEFTPILHNTCIQGFVN
ncbi:GTP cyclohydrolase [Helicobacter monodelphidis]|uniref:YciI family protein n=1 Tax=Helicobacter sp. 15-1451 TaxID=2004995 RepID=UPI000DCF5B0B|nr:YciI family protein [Helicobacter sp. 15-1451]RAX59244.1 GTP cyclohydrolase [Helicobacter sp. 15-1451]